MRRKFVGSVWVAAVLAGGGLTAVGGSEEGFVPLFNGQDLSGWAAVGNASAWSVQKGLLTCQGGGHGWMSTEGVYDNFVLRVEYRISKGGNSGIFVRVPQRFGRSSRLGFEVQILDDHGKEPSNGSTGSLYGMVAPTKNMSKPAGEWNTFEITCDGPMIKIVHNGETIVDINADEVPKVRNRFRRGYLGVQNHGRFVEFRKFDIKRLPSAFDE